MKAIVNTAPGRLELRECPMPTPGAGQVRIKTLACGICATDLEMIKGWERTGFPAVPGHEWAGVVDAVGEQVDYALLGQHCVAENIWQSDGGEVGFEHDGGYAQYFLTEAPLLHTLPPNFPMHAAVLAEPLAVVMRGVNRLGSVKGLRVLIFGDGPIGLLMVMLLNRTGAAEVAIVGGRPHRLRLAESYGAAITVNYHELPNGPLTEGLHHRLDSGFDAVVEASGAGAAADAATELASYNGRILIMGDYAGADAAFPWNRVLHRELTVTGSNTGAGGWESAVKTLQTRRPMLEKMITHRFPAEDFEKAISIVKSRNQNDIKVVMEWNAQ